jgi:hypothetical protein
MVLGMNPKATCEHYINELHVQLIPLLLKRSKANTPCPPPSRVDWSPGACQQNLKTHCRGGHFPCL